VLHAAVQYACGGVPRQPKLQPPALEQVRPTSSPAQYWTPPTTSQRVPVMHCPLDEQGRVQRLAPPATMGRQISGDAHCASEVQSSSSCSPVPPLVLLDDATLEVVVVAPLLALVLEVVAPPVPVVDVVAPPVPAPPEPLLPTEPELPGTHCAFWSQVNPEGQSRTESTQFFLQMPSWQ
jgi:hypothetical protein